MFAIYFFPMRVYANTNQYKTAELELSGFKCGIQADVSWEKRKQQEGLMHLALSATASETNKL